MDLSETMKMALAKNQMGSVDLQQGNNSNNSSSHAGVGYITEKLYMILQLYLQNKGWNMELLQCFSELKDSPVLPSAAYLQVLANRVALDSQGRLVLRDSGKIVLPYEHFANAVMLKHIGQTTAPHGLHLTVEQTVRAVMESYTIGRENFGMEKEFIIEVVTSCPSPACRYYKSHMSVPFIDQNFPAHLQQFSSPGLDMPGGGFDAIAAASKINQSSSQQKMSSKQQQQQSQVQQQQQQITAAIIQQQNRVMAQQSLEKFGNLSNLEKQRVLQQLDKKYLEATQQQQQHHQQSATASSSSSNYQSPSPQLQPVPPPQAMSSSSSASSNGLSSSVLNSHHSTSVTSNNSSAVTASNSQHQQISQTQQQQSHTSQSTVKQMPQLDPTSKITEYLRSNMDTIDAISTSNKDLLALHNGAWNNGNGLESRETAAALAAATAAAGSGGMVVGQDKKIIIAFNELMRNMTRMKQFIRPSMCKPYGKHSDGLQKTLLDTIQLVQSLRSCLPASHIPVSSWKTEDRHRKDSENGTW